jgi:hypothetical protein
MVQEQGESYGNRQRADEHKDGVSAMATQKEKRNERQRDIEILIANEGAEDEGGDKPRRNFSTF